LAADLLAEAAAVEVLPRRTARGGVPEVALVIGRRLLEQREEALPPTASGVLLRGRLLVLERHAIALGQPLDRLSEVELLGLAHEGDQVAALGAAEAVEELVGRIDGEARRLFVVEGTEAGVARARAAQLRARREDRDAVDEADDLALQSVRLVRAGVVEDAVAHLGGQVEPAPVALEHVDDAERMLIVAEAAAQALLQQRVERLFAGVSERCVTKVVA